MSTPRYDRAVRLAASRLLADLPYKATADEILGALSQPELPPGYALSEAIRIPQEDLREWVENLADDFMDFAKLIP
jgi:hypothetical protein